MKKILIAAVLLGAFSFSGMARDNYYRDASALPSAAQEVLKKNFKAGVSFIKEDKSLGRTTEFEVILTDGTEVTFDSKGNWKEIEASMKTGVPASMVPVVISNYVSANHKGTKIVSIEKERNGYDVELSNGVDLKFDSAGKFLRFD